jgi:hypothetical protein
MAFPQAVETDADGDVVLAKYVYPVSRNETSVGLNLVQHAARLEMLALHRQKSLESDLAQHERLAAVPDDLDRSAA